MWTPSLCTAVKVIYLFNRIESNRTHTQLHGHLFDWRKEEAKDISIDENAILKLMKRVVTGKCCSEPGFFSQAQRFALYSKISPWELGYVYANIVEYILKWCTYV